MSAGVLAVIDRTLGKLFVFDGELSEELYEARATVAAVFAERDELKLQLEMMADVLALTTQNEARLSATVAELIEAATQMADATGGDRCRCRDNLRIVLRRAQGKQP